MLSLPLLNLSALCFLSHLLVGMFLGSLCVSAQGVFKALFCLSKRMNLSEPAHLITQLLLLLCKQVLPLLSVLQV